MSSAEASLPAGACRLTLTNEVAAIALACALTRSHAAALGFGERELAQIELGVEEAVSNVVRHAFAAAELHCFDLTLQRHPLGLEILIDDQGLPFDPARIPAYDPARAPQGQLQSALGMHLMRSAFDEVEYRNLGRGGKQTRLLKYRALAPIGERAEPAAEPAAEPVAEVRLLREDDALEVSRLIHDAYGYSYPYEHIYFPERVVALNRSGALVSALAVTAGGAIAGHAALVLDPQHPAGAELAIVVTRMQYRGQGVARRLGDFLLELARQRGLRQLYTHAVTAHPWTQRFMHELGFRDCALLPGHAPASLRFRRIAEALPQRESCMLAVRYLDPDARAARSAVVAPAQRALLQAIYQALEVPLQLLDAPAASPALPAHGSVDAALHGGLELAQLRVDGWGEDTLPTLRARLAQLRRERMAVIELQVPLLDPASARMATAIEALGFVFSGVSPGVTPAQDRLVYNHVADPGFDYDAPNIHSELGQRLRAQMRAQAAASA